jgi:hypothetical protein
MKDHLFARLHLLAVAAAARSMYYKYHYAAP